MYLEKTAKNKKKIFGRNCVCFQAFPYMRVTCLYEGINPLYKGVFKES